MREEVSRRTKLGLVMAAQLACTVPNPAYRPPAAAPDAGPTAHAEPLVAPDAAANLAPDLPPPMDLRPLSLFLDAAPDTRPDAAPTGLVAHWRLDESEGAAALDELGNNPGTLRNGAGRASGCPRLGFSNPGALAFDGDDDYVELGVAGLPAMQAVKSVSAWCRAANLSTTARRNVVVFNNQSARQSLQLGLDRGFPAVWSWGPEPAPLISAIRLDQEWHHLAYVYDGAVQRLYVDGVQMAWLPQPPPTATVAGAYLGTYDPVRDGSERWDGAIDDVRIYGRALTPAEVTWLAQGND